MIRKRITIITLILTLASTGCPASVRAAEFAGHSDDNDGLSRGTGFKIIQKARDTAGDNDRVLMML